MISVIIPHWPFNEAVNQRLKVCVSSLRDAEEIIIIVNDGTGFAKAVNQGLRLANCDFFCVVNNDTFMNRGSLAGLPRTDTVTFPMINETKQEFSGAFFCLPRTVYEEVGEIDEQFELGYWEDVDYWLRLKEAGVCIKQIEDVGVVHKEPGYTMKQTPPETDFKNRERFFLKWGYFPEKSWI